MIQFLLTQKIAKLLNVLLLKLVDKLNLRGDTKSCCFIKS